MGISRFSPLPEKQELLIPFAMSEANLQQWVRALPETDDYATANQLFTMLREVIELSLDAQSKFRCVEILHQEIKSSVNKLQKVFIDSSFPLAHKERQFVELIVWSYAELATAYAQCQEDIDESDDRQLQAVMIFHAMSSLGQALLYVSLVYEQPYTGFWSFAYKLYKQAEKLELLQLKVIQDRDDVDSIEAAFKYLLSFYECDTNQFRPREIQTIHQFLRKYAKQTVVSNSYNEKQGDFYRILDLKGDRPPAAVYKISSDQRSTIRYLMVMTVAKEIHLYLEKNLRGSGMVNVLNRFMYSRVVKNLSHIFKRRKFTRIKENHQKQGLIGIDNLITYLGKDSSNSVKLDVRVKDYDPRVSGLWKIPDLELVPMGDEVFHQQQYSNSSVTGLDQTARKILENVGSKDSSENIWEIAPVSEQEEALVGEFEVIDSSVKGYGLSASKGQSKISSKVGEIIGIFNDKDERIEIGIICRISKPAANRIRFGIDLIGMECHAVSLSMPGQEHEKISALFIPAIKGMIEKDCIVFKSGVFTTGEYVSMVREGKKIPCRLQKLLVSTASVSHMEVFYPESSVGK